MTSENSKIYWAKSKAVIVIHEATTGFAYDLRDYLLKLGIQELLFIAHPLLYLKENFKKSSRYELYRNGKLIKSKVAASKGGKLKIKEIKRTIARLYTIGRLNKTNFLKQESLNKENLLRQKVNQNQKSAKKQ